MTAVFDTFEEGDVVVITYGHKRGNTAIINKVYGRNVSLVFPGVTPASDNDIIAENYSLGDHCIAHLKVWDTTTQKVVNENINHPVSTEDNECTN